MTSVDRFAPLPVSHNHPRHPGLALSRPPRITRRGWYTRWIPPIVVEVTRLSPVLTFDDLTEDAWAPESAADEGV